MGMNTSDPSDSVAYPAEPWDLYGHAHAGVWLVPRRVAPPPHHPGTRQIRLFGRVIVVAAFFCYSEPSPLVYDEVMATQLVRDGWRPRVSITHIWVDSAASKAGGRDLWAIPKELAQFDRVTNTYYEARGTGTLNLRRLRRLPFRLPLAFKVAQQCDDGALVTTPVAGRARLGVASGAWSFAPDGPLGFLAGRTPALTATVNPFRLSFGRP